MSHPEGETIAITMLICLQISKKIYRFSHINYPGFVAFSYYPEFFSFELHVSYADFITFLLFTIIYFYGGYPFLKGIKEELAEKTPGMITLITIAISVAYLYSSTVVSGLQGGVFF
jgi:Cu2+-exporting ATPase